MPLQRLPKHRQPAGGRDDGGRSPLSQPAAEAKPAEAGQPIPPATSEISQKRPPAWPETLCWERRCLHRLWKPRRHNKPRFAHWLTNQASPTLSHRADSRPAQIPMRQSSLLGAPMSSSALEAPPSQHAPLCPLANEPSLSHTIPPRRLSACADSNAAKFFAGSTDVHIGSGSPTAGTSPALPSRQPT
ncbi:hypothetical protein HNQ65_003997 [Prosthecobacter vanneervenii]|uniref:Uncharacterized protein n=1 Tax=Prosthecobacter vanneervenii TaxID=48466 RepID=A0A7W7YDY3_9BACT|nr:hypothetical protein [Prosthecobacter vanneervenii]